MPDADTPLLPYPVATPTSSSSSSSATPTSAQGSPVGSPTIPHSASGGTSLLHSFADAAAAPAASTPLSLSTSPTQQQQQQQFYAAALSAAGLPSDNYGGVASDLGAVSSSAASTFSALSSFGSR